MANTNYSSCVDTADYNCLWKTIEANDIKLQIIKEENGYKIIGIKDSKSETCVKLKYNPGPKELYLDSLLLNTCRKNKSGSNCNPICHDVRGTDFLNIILKIASENTQKYIKLIDAAKLYENYFGTEDPVFSTIQLLTKKRTFYEGYGYLPVIKYIKSTQNAYSYEGNEYLDIFRKFIEFRTSFLTIPIKELADLIKKISELDFVINILDDDKLTTNLKSLTEYDDKSLVTLFAMALQYLHNHNDKDYKKWNTIFYDIYEIINEVFANFNISSEYYYVLDDAFNKQILDIYHSNGISVNENFFKTPTAQLGGRKTHKSRKHKLRNQTRKTKNTNTKHKYKTQIK